MKHSPFFVKRKWYTKFGGKSAGSLFKEMVNAGVSTSTESFSHLDYLSFKRIALKTEYFVKITPTIILIRQIILIRLLKSEQYTNVASFDCSRYYVYYATGMCEITGM